MKHRSKIPFGPFPTVTPAQMVNWKLSKYCIYIINLKKTFYNTNRTHTMHIELIKMIQLKNYTIQMKNYENYANGKLQHINGNYTMQIENYKIQMKSIKYRLNTIIQYKWKFIQYKLII